MKFYTTIRNEKGKQEAMGGNEYLDIDIRAGNKIIAMFTLREDDNGDYTLFDEDDEPVKQSYVVKGKKQVCEKCKGKFEENCAYCMVSKGKNQTGDKCYVCGYVHSTLARCKH